ncbi:cytidylyltransferase domain-containing protein [Alkalimarinus sediminis]|uniref:Acylneuraminate cytidylyltransferase family protein n=1 Tax=Alkalimarinus sediminis TaxID=1632866 RepID=A0A9E8HF03_9ALTE|nr:acylneuraminate cytidylyltransferase family protein [Alkalimarinus sediminis]UZW73425.1 acylneuraminate cytidylyltransferase family protein [Alkalimarinus sediminis]
MLNDKKILIVIPARGGSKRLPRKNVLPLTGKPLICWTIEAALESSLNAKIIVTSDDDEILSVVHQYKKDGVIAYKRPAALATDTAATIDVIKDACLYSKSIQYAPETIVLLQPTSPLRNAENIRAAIDLYNKKDSQDTVVSVCEVEHPTAWVGSLNEDDVLTNIDFTGKRSQEYAKEYRLNGAIYVIDYQHVKTSGSIFSSNVYAYVMPKDKSVDIDDLSDFKYARLMMETNGG